MAGPVTIAIGFTGYPDGKRQEFKPGDTVTGEYADFLREEKPELLKREDKETEIPSED